MDIRNILHCIRHPQKAMIEHRAKERKICRRGGENPENIYYVIRCDLPECGFFAIFMYILDHLAIAEKNGYIPILDMEQYDTLYKEKMPVNGTTDPWNYYFENISDVQLSDCRQFANVIYSAIAFPHYKGIYYYSDNAKNVLPDAPQIHDLKEIVEKYIHFRSNVKSQLDMIAERLLGEEKVLGIHVRGTDMYREGKQHPVPTGETKDFSKIDDIIEKHGISRILLCTDTEATVDLFKEKYGNMLVTTQAVRQKDNFRTGIHKDVALSGREFHRYKMGMEVLTDMYLLSKCCALICGPSNVAFTSIIYNDNQYEEIYYFS